MKKKRLEKSGLLTFSDFSDLLTQSGRRTVNSDSFIINDLNKKGTWRVHLKDFGVSQTFLLLDIKVGKCTSKYIYLGRIT